MCVTETYNPGMANLWSWWLKVQWPQKPFKTLVLEGSGDLITHWNDAQLLPSIWWMFIVTYVKMDITIVEMDQCMVFIYNRWMCGIVRKMWVASHSNARYTYIGVTSVHWSDHDVTILFHVAPTVCQLYYQVSCVRVHNQIVYEIVTHAHSVCCVSGNIFNWMHWNLHSNMKQTTMLVLN